VLLGDRRRYLTALIVPNFEKLERDAAAKGIDTSSREELVKDPGVIAMFQDEIDRFNKNLDRQEKVRRFALIHRDFSIEEDEITPSLKVKRKNIDQKYKPMIDEMYADELEGTSL
jgi:long-chain acyl-CoA synthetase